MVKRRKPKVLIVDLMMPNLGGVELYQALEAADPALAGRVAFITAGAITAPAQALLERTGRPVLGKPFEAAALREVVSRLLREPGGEPRPAEAAPTAG